MQRSIGLTGIVALASGLLSAAAFADTYSTQSVTQYSTQNGYSTHTTIQTPQGTQTFDTALPPGQLNIGSTFPPMFPPMTFPFPFNSNSSLSSVNSSFSSMNSASSVSSANSSASSTSSAASQSSSASSIMSSSSMPISSSSASSSMSFVFPNFEFFQQQMQQLQNTLNQIFSNFPFHFINLPFPSPGSGSSSSSSTSSATTTIRTFQTTLTGNQQVPPVSTSGTGLGSFTVSGSTLGYHITVQNLSGPVTAAHFHLAPAGQTGAIIKPISFSGTTANGTWTLNANQLTNLLNDDIYVNVHTALHPDGEIRGQLMP